MSDLIAYIDLYCERTAQGVFNEPLNAVSNASFIVAAWWASRQFNEKQASPMFTALCVLAALIGVGSIAFHTLPSRLTQWLDVIPIWAFVVTYTLAVTHAAFGKRWQYTSGIFGLGIVSLVIVFVVTGDAISAAPSGANVHLFNGSLQYLPVVLVLLFFSVGASFMNHAIKHHLWWATGVFFVSLTCRTIDIAVCGAFPSGTHFLWHLLDGILIAILLHGLFSTWHGVNKEPMN